MFDCLCITASPPPLLPLFVNNNYLCFLQAGAHVRTYHGCPKCDQHIWDEKDVGNDCPVPGCDGKRKDANGTPYQEVLHFPLKPRLEALMRCRAYSFALGYESWRPQPEKGIVAGLSLFPNFVF